MTCKQVVILIPDDNPDSNRTFDAFEGIKEYYADFNTRSYVVDLGVSIERRPDAVSFDYLTAYTIGPNDIGDSFFGPIFRTWKVYSEDGYHVYAQRSNDTDDGFFPPIRLFTIDPLEPPLVELDAAFDQNARVTVVAERISGVGDSPEIWIYWFDPFIGAFNLTNFGRGRAPKALLDDLVSIFLSDILVFYSKDSVGELVYRQQRDRYQIEYSTSIAAGGNTFVEDAFRTKGNRIGLILAKRDVLTGRYSLERHESTLYPYLFELEPWLMGCELTAGSLLTIIIPYSDFRDDWVLPGLEFIAASFENVTPPEDHTLSPDGVSWKMAATAGTFVVAVLLHPTYDVDEHEFESLELRSGSLALIVIVHEFNETYALPNIEFISGYLGA